jgi:hypothetical protein
MSAPHIESYRFGRVVVDGQVHKKDLIILPDRVVGGWWRGEGHALHPADLELVFDAQPEVLVVGQGADGLMQVTPETQQALQAAGIQLIARPTGDACRVYNELSPRQSVAAALHLTC